MELAPSEESRLLGTGREVRHGNVTAPVPALGELPAHSTHKCVQYDRTSDSPALPGFLSDRAGLLAPLEDHPISMWDAPITSRANFHSKRAARCVSGRLESRRLHSRQVIRPLWAKNTAESGRYVNRMRHRCTSKCESVALGKHEQRKVKSYT